MEETELEQLQGTVNGLIHAVAVLIGVLRHSGVIQDHAAEKLESTTLNPKALAHSSEAVRFWAERTTGIITTASQELADMLGEAVEDC